MLWPGKRADECWHSLCPRPQKTSPTSLALFLPPSLCLSLSGSLKICNKLRSHVRACPSSTAFHVIYTYKYPAQTAFQGGMLECKQNQLCLKSCPTSASESCHLAEPGSRICFRCTRYLTHIIKFSIFPSPAPPSAPPPSTGPSTFPLSFSRPPCSFPPPPPRLADDTPSRRASSARSESRDDISSMLCSWDESARTRRRRAEASFAGEMTAVCNICM